MTHPMATVKMAFKSQFHLHKKKKARRHNFNNPLHPLASIKPLPLRSPRQRTRVWAYLRQGRNCVLRISSSILPLAGARHKPYVRWFCFKMETSAEKWRIFRFIWEFPAQRRRRATILGCVSVGNIPSFLASIYLTISTGLGKFGKPHEASLWIQTFCRHCLHRWF